MRYTILLLSLGIASTACQSTPTPDAYLPSSSPAVDGATVQPPQSPFDPTAEGRWEVTLGGGGNNDPDFEAGLAAVNGSVGYFVADDFLIGVRQSVLYSDAGNTSTSDWNGSTRIAADYHLDLGNVRPFVGANFGWVYGETVKETLAAAPEAGVKVFLQDDAFLLGMAEYQFFFDEDDRIGNAFDNGQFVYTIGMGMTF